MKVGMVLRGEERSVTISDGWVWSRGWTQTGSVVVALPAALTGVPLSLSFSFETLTSFGP